MDVEDLQGKYLLLRNVDTFEWPDNYFPYFQMVENCVFKGHMTCLYSDGLPNKAISGVLYHDKACGHIRIAFNALTCDLECSIEGSYYALYQYPSEEAIERMQRATHYQIVATRNGGHSLCLKEAETGRVTLKFAIADEPRNKRSFTRHRCQAKQS